jgi:hypothetical protein
MVKSLVEDSNKVILKFDEVIHKVGEESIEHLKGSINLDVFS